MPFRNSELMLGSPALPKQHFFQEFPTHRAFTLPHNNDKKQLFENLHGNFLLGREMKQA
jgi:hypothetical protein